MNALLLAVLAAALMPTVDYSAMTAEWSQPQASVVQRIPMDVYAPAWCLGCKTPKRELEADGRFDLTIHSDTQAFPGWVLNILNEPDHFYPVIVWRNSAGVQAYFARTWGGVNAFLRVVDRHEAAKMRQASVAQPKVIQRSVSGVYPVRGSHWTFPGSSYGDILDHLDDGQHRGKFDKAWLRTLSYDELRSLHDDDHEGRVKWAYVNRPVKSYPPNQRAAVQASRQPQYAARTERRKSTAGLLIPLAWWAITNCPNCPR